MAIQQLKTYFTLHVKFLFKRPILLSAAIVIQCLAACSLLMENNNIWNNSRISFFNTLPIYQNLEELFYKELPEDGLTLQHVFQNYKWTVFMSSHLVFFYLIFDLVAEEKRNNIYILIRKLRASEPLYWLSVAVTGLIITMCSNLLGTYFIKNILIDDLPYFANVDFAPLFLLQQTSSMAVVSYGIFWSSFVSRKEFVSIITLIFALGYIAWIPAGASPYPAGHSDITITFNTGEQEELTGWGLIVYNIFYERYHIVQTPAYEIGKAMTNMLRIITAKGLGEVHYELRSLVYPALCYECIPEDTSSRLASCFFSSPITPLSILISSTFIFLALAAKVATYNGTSVYIDVKFEDGPEEELTLKGLHKSYNDEKTVVINEITHKFHRGNVYSIVGKGNKILLNLIAGKMKKSDGIVQYSGNVAFLEESPLIVGGLTALEHVSLYVSLLGVTIPPTLSIDIYAGKLLRQVGLESQLYTSVTLFGPEMRKRLEFILNTIGSPNVILLEEPTSGLDLKSAEQIRKVISNLKKNSIVISASDCYQDADLISDEIIVLKKGKLASSFKSQELKNNFKNSSALCIDIVPNFRITKNVDVILKWLESSIPGAKVISSSKFWGKVGYSSKYNKELSAATQILDEESVRWSISPITIVDIINGFKDEHTMKSLNHKVHAINSKKLNITEQALEITHVRRNELLASIMSFVDSLSNDYVILLILLFYSTYLMLGPATFATAANLLRENFDQDMIPHLMKLHLAGIPFLILALSKDLSWENVSMKLHVGSSSFTIISGFVICYCVCMVFPVAFSFLFFFISTRFYILIPLLSIANVAIAIWLFATFDSPLLASWVVLAGSQFAFSNSEDLLSLYPPIGILRCFITGETTPHAILAVIGSVILLLVGFLNLSIQFRLLQSKKLLNVNDDLENPPNQNRFPKITTVSSESEIQIHNFLSVQQQLKFYIMTFGAQLSGGEKTPVDLIADLVLLPTKELAKFSESLSLVSKLRLKIAILLLSGKKEILVDDIEKLTAQQFIAINDTIKNIALKSKNLKVIAFPDRTNQENFKNKEE